ncbi:MAG TPA: hypothetical protein VMB03_29390 [Bryobacteraceae bacterium]|nr:hypothetical protein [Bryobacteraceae bacterium]
MQFTKCAVAMLLAAPVFGSGGNPAAAVTVHEWGTFTTIADGAGGSEPWSPLGGTSDLPCFVERLNGLAYKFMPPTRDTAPAPTVTVRMETPVLYFYSPRKTVLSLAVDFPKGLITEWYPAATAVKPGRQLNLPPVRDGRIEWNGVEIAPGESAALPRTAGASHYFAARNTDSDLLRIGKQQEKLIFYRGIADFSVPLSARFTGEHSMELRNPGGDPLLAVVFENRGGQIGYRILRALRGTAAIELPPLNGNPDSLERELANALVAQGLYRKEADAMIETWRDSWFEEGMRIFYLVPRSLVDRELPLRIQPAPAKIARVFVGREEILSPYLRERLTAALSQSNTRTLDGFGRFLAPFLKQVKVDATPSVAAYLAEKSKQAANQFYNPTCVR